jgi:dihydroorotate dehydrogenase (NAD+) catalytic subunit
VILNASGCLDALTAPEVVRSLDAYVTKTVTPVPRDGNRPVRIAETEAGMLNSIGLANPGLAAFVANYLPRAAELGVPIWVSVGGFTAADYAESCAVLDRCDRVATIELNLSCPNVEEAPDDAAEIVAASRRATTKPLYAKLAPAPDLVRSARACADAGADGLSLVNTLRGLALNPRTLHPLLGSATGGYSGPALRPVALAAVYSCYAETGLSIVGMGGVETGRDALELIAAGARGVALGTVLFRYPDAPRRVRNDVVTVANALGFEAPGDAFASAHKRVSTVTNPPRPVVETVDKSPGIGEKIVA